MADIKDIDDSDIKIKNPLKYGEEHNSELIASYLHPEPKCSICTSSLNFDISKDYSEGIKLYSLLKKYKEKFDQETGKNLTLGMLKNHFSKHFNPRGAAISTYNQLLNIQEEEKEKTAVLVIDPDQPIAQLFNHAKDKYVDDFKILDLTTKNLIMQIHELELIKQEKKAQDASYAGLNVIEQQKTILQGLYNNSLNKIKALQQGKLQQAQINAINQYNLLGVQNYQIDNQTMSNISKEIVEQTQKMFAKIVITKVVTVLSKTVDILKLSLEDKAVFFKTFQKNIKGIESEILDEFRRYISDTFKEN